MGNEISAIRQYGATPTTSPSHQPTMPSPNKDTKALLQEIRKINTNIEKLFDPIQKLSKDMELIAVHSKIQPMALKAPEKENAQTEVKKNPVVTVDKPDNAREEISLANYGNFDFVWQGGSFAFAMFTLRVLPGRKGSLEPATQVSNYSRTTAQFLWTNLVLTM